MSNYKLNDFSVDRMGNAKNLQEIEKKDHFALALDKYIEEYVNAKMKDDDPTRNQFISPAQRRAKFAEDYRKSLNSTEVEKRVSRAINILQNEGLVYFTHDEHHLLKESFDHLFEQLNSINTSELNHESYKAAVSMPQSVIDLIFKVAIEKYNQHLLLDSLSLFALLSILKEDEPDYMYRFGLVAQECEQYEQALRAFNDTSLLAPEFIEAHIYAAVCYLKIGQQANAEFELEKAKEIIKSSNVDEFWQKNLFDVEAMLISAA